MPYIDEEDRHELDTFSDREAETAGELNYLFTRVAHRYVEHHGRGYGTFNDVMGAFESAKLEFYRRVVAPYEDRKAAINGDVLPDA